MIKKFLVLTVLLLLFGACSTELGLNADVDMPEELKEKYISIIQDQLDLLEEGKNSTDIYLELGYAYQKINEYDLALDAYDVVLESNVDSYQALNNSMDIYRELEEWDMAAERARRLYQSNQENAQVLSKVVMILLEAGEVNNAYEALENFIKIVGDDSDYQDLIERLYEQISKAE